MATIIPFKKAIFSIPSDTLSQFKKITKKGERSQLVSKFIKKFITEGARQNFANQCRVFKNTHPSLAKGEIVRLIQKNRYQNH